MVEVARRGPAGMPTAPAQHAPPSPSPSPSLRVGRRRYPVVLPSWRDPRLHQSAVLLSVQALGQTVLGFELSIAQILLALGTCAVLEVAVTAWRRGVLAWPASALLTGNGVALILRVPGTEAGDRWSLHGWWIFVAVAAGALLSKYLIRVGGRHVFNPSNVALVVAFLALGAERADPQVLWWGHLDAGLAFTVALILGGGLLVLRRLRLLALAAAFWVSFAALIAALSASGHCMSAPWHVGPVCGASFWWVLVSSPEILIFALFMITDPKTTPARPWPRAAFGVAVGAVAAAAVAPQRSEFGTKVAVLAALVIVCAAVPALTRLAEAAPMRRAVTWSAARAATPARAAASGAVAAVVGVALTAPAVVALGGPARPESFFATLAERWPLPEDRLPPGVALPPVIVPEEARRLDPSLDDVVVERMAVDLVADLEVLARAMADRDPSLAEEGASGLWLADVVAAIDEAARTGVVEVPRYRYHAIEAVMVRIPGSRQAAPELGLEVHATVTSELVPSTPGGTATPGGEREYRQAFRFVVSERGDRYLIAGPGERWE